ncbi:YitT family protein [Paenibacillus thermotolerans]|uniref:YitT family protein n=1 Tax=Paenibacillus thermotolerans TaxID=3027807 RepID=UPI0023685D6E|nr:MULTISPECIES: YitT family protein [unclassified Paenibacillus]
MFKRAASFVLIIVGSFMISVGLELFLLPNQVTAGGIAGLSVLVSHMTEMKLSLVLFVINVPFILAKAKYSVRSPLLAVLPLLFVGVFTYFLHPASALVDEPLLAALGGGTFLGLGLGVIFRQGGRFDEPESAVRLLPFFRNMSVSSVLFCINLLILLLAGIVFGWQQAVYSMLAHSLAYCMVEVGFTGLSPFKRIMVRSRHIGSMQSTTEHMYRVMWVPTGEEHTALCIVHRSDAARIKQALKKLDRDVQLASSLYYEMNARK